MSTTMEKQSEPSVLSKLDNGMLNCFDDICSPDNNNNGEDCDDEEKVIPKIRLQGPFGGGNQGSANGL